MTFTLIGIKKETDRVQTFRFSSDAPVVYRAGQHVNLRLMHEKVDNRGTIRSFSLSSSPTERHLAVTTNRGDSSFKKRLFSLPVGDTIEARGPGGGFVFREEHKDHHVMIAGGIGITPFRSMLASVNSSKLDCPITLLYSNRTPEEIVFRQYLEQSIRFKLVHTITRPEASGVPWNGRIGRIDERCIIEYSKAESIYYVCGSEQFVEAVTGLLSLLKVPAERVRFEKFPGYTS